MKTLLLKLAAAALLFSTFLNWSFAQTPPTPTVIQFAQDSFEIEEADTGGLVRFSVSSIIATTGLNFRIQITGGTATRAVDYPATMAGQLHQYPSSSTWFQVIDDGVHEPDETVELTLSDPGPNIVFGPRAKTVVTIRNSPPTLLLYYAPYDFMEQPGAANREIVIVRTGDRETATSVDVDFKPGGGPAGTHDATPGVDYRANNERVEFGSGERERQVTVQILDDGGVEEPEFFTATLSNPSPETILKETTLAIAIGDNEHAANFYVGEIVKEEFPLILLGNGGAPSVTPWLGGSWRLLGDGGLALAQEHPAGGWLLRLWGDGGPVLVNGFPQTAWARLDAQGELDTAFRFAPPEDGLIGDGRMLGLRSGGAVLEYLAIDRALNRHTPVIRFLRADGSYDPKFAKIALEEQDRVLGLGETSNGTVTILVRHTRQVNGFDKFTSELIRVTAQGERLPGVLLPDSEYYSVESIPPLFMPDGSFYIDRRPVENNLTFEPVTWRFLADGSLDPAFKPIEGSPALSLPDGRIVIGRTGYEGNDVRLIHPNGELDSSFQRIVFAFCPEANPFEIVGLVNGRLRVRFGCFSAEDDYRQQAGEIILTNPPATALALAGPMSPAIHLSKRPESAGFSIPMVRLGSNTVPATVHYTTRDVTATAGKDYVSQSGTITFAPLETEKTIQIPILTDTEDEFDETLEVVVTAAEGFEALPAPMRLTILGKGPAPRLDRVKRLRDGRVLLGGTGPQDSTRLEFSADLQSWHPLPNLLGGFNGSDAIWLDASATNAPTRYYRAVAR